MNKTETQNYSGTGMLRVRVYTARSAQPVANASVTVTLDDGTVLEKKADEGGIAGPFSIPCPPKSLSLEPENEKIPYATCDVTAKADSYDIATTLGVQVFDTVESMMDFALLPAEDPEAGVPSRPRSLIDEVFTIPEHHLFSGKDFAVPRPVDACKARLLSVPVIPTKITVHLGKPSANVRDVTVSFRDYIKNVASSEVYPTWPDEALRANIHAQISLAINRIYTEWYKSKGYPFQITGSPSYDQAYVHGRNIFEPMSRITDQIFNTYTRKQGTVNPYFTEYCDGRSVTCKGMKQWGTKELADEGKNALQILQFYYGKDLEIVRTNNIAKIPESYPGTPLRRGSRGEDVRTIQRQLNRIAQDYPFLGRGSVDGIFGTTTENIVKAFQKQFNLPADGVVGKKTWYKISYIYVSVKDLSELTSEGERPNGQLVAGTYPGKILQEGDRGNNVEQIQFWLSEIAKFTNQIPAPSIDGIFGAGTERSVRAFQRHYDLSVDGIVGRDTWNKIYSVYVSIEKDIAPPGELTGSPGAYPGEPLRRGSRGDGVRRFQFWLRIIAGSNSSVPTVTVDGVFGASTERSVRAFQTFYRLVSDGIVGKSTWNKGYEVYTDIINELLDPNERPGTYPGTALRVGSRGRAVKEMQYYLYLMSAYYSEIPRIDFDGNFGNKTRDAVIAFQKLFTLTADGVVGKTTWDAIYNQFSRLRNVDGPLIAFRAFVYPGEIIKEGDEGNMVKFIQFMLLYIASFWDNILPIEDINGIYDEETRLSIISFQRGFELPMTGEVDEKTWNALVITYLSFASIITDPNLPFGEYPGYTLGLGSAGNAVLDLQIFMNSIAQSFCAAWFVPESGIFDKDTETAVKEFQAGFGLPITGLVDRATWETIYAYYLSEE